MSLCPKHFFFKKRKKEDWKKHVGDCMSFVVRIWKWTNQTDKNANFTKHFIPFTKKNIFFLSPSFLCPNLSKNKKKNKNFLYFSFMVFVLFSCLKRGIFFILCFLCMCHSTFVPFCCWRCSFKFNQINHAFYFNQFKFLFPTFISVCFLFSFFVYSKR